MIFLMFVCLFLLMFVCLFLLMFVYILPDCLDIYSLFFVPLHLLLSPKFYNCLIKYHRSSCLIPFLISYYYYSHSFTYPLDHSHNSHPTNISRNLPAIILVKLSLVFSNSLFVLCIHHNLVSISFILDNSNTPLSSVSCFSTSLHTQDMCCVLLTIVYTSSTIFMSIY